MDYQLWNKLKNKENHVCIELLKIFFYLTNKSKKIAYHCEKELFQIKFFKEDYLKIFDHQLEITNNTEDKKSINIKNAINKK